MDDLHHFANQRNQQQLKERLNSVEDRLRHQDRKQSEQEDWQKWLYNDSLKLEKDIEALTNELDAEKLQKNAKRVARYYEINVRSTNSVFNADRYNALDYKELATKSAERLKILKEMPWYDWGKKQTAQEVATHFENLAAEEEKKKAAALEASNGNLWGNPFVWVLVGIIIGIIAYFAAET